MSAVISIKEHACACSNLTLDSLLKKVMKDKSKHTSHSYTLQASEKLQQSPH